jgi:hypothetical protein
VVLILPLSILSSIRNLCRRKLVLLRLEQKTRLVDTPVWISFAQSVSMIIKRTIFVGQLPPWIFPSPALWRR